MFKRREKRSFLKQIKELVWPSMGFGRGLKYLALRVLRLSDADGHDVIAQSVAWGVAVSFFPTFGVHAIMAAAIAAALRLNLVVCVLATLLIPAVVLPVIFSIDFFVGRKILKSFGIGGWGSQASFERTTATGDWGWITEHFHDFAMPALIGFLIFLPLAWSTGYMATHKVMDILRARYRRKHKGHPA